MDDIKINDRYSARVYKYNGNFDGNYDYWINSIQERETMTPFNRSLFVGTEIGYIEEAINNRKLCGDGGFTKRCSRWFEDEYRISKALLTTSCTHATEMAVMFSEINKGDEVIMPSFTFVSTADAVVLGGQFLCLWTYVPIR